MNDIQSKLFEYVREHNQDCKTSARGKVKIFTCPFCGGYSAQLIPNSIEINCHQCRKYFKFVDIVRHYEEDKKALSDNDIEQYLAKKYGIELPDKNIVEKMLDFYVRCGFDLVPVARNDKMPIEKDWPNKTHKTKVEWLDWLNNGLNLGVKTGKISSITVLDFDTKELPEVMKKYLPSLPYQETAKGYHFPFQYVTDLPTSRIDNLKIDVLNDGKQFVTCPSVVGGVERKWFFADKSINEIEIPKIPDDVKEFILSNLTIYGSNIKTLSESFKEDINTENIENIGIGEIGEGNRNNWFIKFGGILRKTLNMTQTKSVLHIVNKHIFNPPLDTQQFDKNIKTLEKYCIFDEKELAMKIFRYLEMVEEANSTDIKATLEEPKAVIEKALSWLVKEGYLLKRKRMYHIIKKAEWKDTFVSEGQPIDFVMPYFHDCAIFRYGDMIIIGGNTGTGKSHIAMNIIKRLVRQGKKPNYISLESGNRFATIAQQLGLHEGDFNWCVHFSPEEITLDKDAITILDWLLPNDYAQTDKIYKHFAEQLSKQGGILIVFVQLKENSEFFAPNMIEMFPSFVVKFLYDDEQGISSKFITSKIREAKDSKSAHRKVVPTVYDFDTMFFHRY